MILPLLYHRIGKFGKKSISPELFETHLKYIKDHYPVVLPGETLNQKMAICLTFDDATFDFYHTVFPLLQRYQLRALLGVPVRYILNSTTQASKDRLNIPHALMMQDGFFDKKAPFCTWQEIHEMVQSGYVQVASHSLSHSNLTFSFVNWKREIHLSQQILEEKLSQAITSFIYPFGKYNYQIHHFVKNFYQYSFARGYYPHRSWKSQEGPLLRLCLDGLQNPSEPFRLRNQIKRIINIFN